MATRGTGTWWMRRIQQREHSTIPARRAKFENQVRRLRHWFELLRGSAAQGDVENDLLKTMIDVADGLTRLSSRWFGNEKDFLIALRKELHDRYRGR
jgi:hypothetical protein